MTQPAAQHRTYGAGWQILRVSAGLSLIYYAWMMLDLVTHPFSPGSNAGSIPFLFRWLSAITGTFTVVIAVFIIRRVPANINGLLLLFFGVGAAGWSLRTDFGSPTIKSLLLLSFGVYFFCVSFPALVALIFHYPTGQVFPQRLSSWVWGLLSVGVIAGILTVLASPSIDPAIANPVYLPALFPYFTALNVVIVVFLPSVALIFLGLRFRAAGLAERLQIKWLLWLVGLGMVVTILTALFFPASSNGAKDSSATLIANIVGYIYWQAFPAVAIGIALLRHRLWDIDLIIRRTLVYGVLSGALALIYFGGVTLFQWLFTALTGQQSPASIVISTLVIAALFTPLRRRVQGFIDQRFYRQKYDTARALENFSTASRAQVNLAELTGQLENLVQETVQPESVTLWMRKERP